MYIGIVVTAYRPCLLQPVDRVTQQCADHRKSTMDVVQLEQLLKNYCVWSWTTGMVVDNM